MMGLLRSDDASIAEQIDSIIVNAGAWRGVTLATLRRIIATAHRDIVEEIKWRKPSKPEGVATWVCDGNICMADVLKNAVRLTFPKGARVADPDHLFNSRLDSSAVRAIDFFEHSPIDETLLQDLIVRAVAVNREGLPR